LKSFPPKKRSDLNEVYPAAGPDAIDLLNKCLIFNPKKRILIEEGMKHPFLAKVRDTTKEQLAGGPVILEFDKEGELGVERLRELFCLEIKTYHGKKWEIQKWIE